MEDPETRPRPASPPEQRDQPPPPPSYRQMGVYALVGAGLALISLPNLYAIWMRRSPLTWFSEASFRHFGWFVLAAGIVFALVLIGSHGEDD